MIWSTPKRRWNRWFALIPISAGGETVWLQWYWSRFAGDCVEVSFKDPNHEAD